MNLIEGLVDLHHLHVRKRQAPGSQDLGRGGGRGGGREGEVDREK